MDIGMVESDCDFCKTKPSKYRCPKCNYNYCSTECYRSEQHGVCSQQFYREEVFTALRDIKADEETKIKTLQLIKKSRECDQEEEKEAIGANGAACADVDESSDESEDEEELADRMKGIDLGVDDLTEEAAAKIWSRLTEAERAQFDSLVASGDILSLIPEDELYEIHDTKVG